MIIGADIESEKIQAGVLAPPLVCLSWAERARSTPVLGGFARDLDLGVSAPVFNQGLLLRDDAIAWFRQRLLDRSILVIHNMPFDVADLCNEAPDLLLLVFDALRNHLLRCTIVRQKLLDIAFGMRKFRRVPKEGGRIAIVKSTYSLADLIELYYGEVLQKKDTWQKSYALLKGVPLEKWPKPAKDYALKDSVEHVRVYEAQDQVIAARFGGNLPNQAEQQRAAMALHLMSAWGVRAEQAAVDRFIAHCEEEIAKMKDDLRDTGIFKAKYKCGKKCEHTANVPWQACPRCGEYRCKPNRDAGTRSMAEIRKRVIESCARRNVAVPMTDPSPMYPEGQVVTDKEALEETDDPALHVLATQMTFVKHLGQWGPVCRAAVHRPVCARYEVLVETGRTSCSGSEGQEGTNFQNPPRSGDVRPCFIPRCGCLFCSTDADTIELRALAQDCLELVGWSKMADALWDQHKNGGADLHVRLAAGIMGISIEEANRRKKEGDAEVTFARQFAKIPNFGFPGGLGAETMVTYAAGQLDKATHQKWFGVERKEQIAKATRLREIWFETWPEMRRYFEIVGKMIDRRIGEGTIQQLMSMRIRGGVRFTAAANGFFQGRVADAMKEILFRLAEECYTGRCTSAHVHGGSSLCTVDGRSILYGSRPVMFLHDEPILEHPEDGTESDRAERQRQIVVECLSRWMKDVPCTSQAVLMRRWQKGAEPLRVNGQLVPVKPEKFEKDGKVKIRWTADYAHVSNL